MNFTAAVDALDSRNQMAVLPVSGAAATSKVLPGFVVSPVKRRRNRLGPVMVMSYFPSPYPVPMFKQSDAVPPASTVYCQGSVERYTVGWIERCAALLAGAPWLAMENQARIFPAVPNSSRFRSPFVR